MQIQGLLQDPLVGLLGPLDPVVTGWLTRISNAGGARPSNSTINAVNTFWLSCQSVSIDSLMYAVNCFVPDNLIAACTPLVQNVGFPSWNNVNLGGTQFLTSDLSVNGLSAATNSTATWNGSQYTTGKYLDPGFPLNTFSMTNGGVSSFHSYPGALVGGDGDNSLCGAYPSDSSPHIYDLVCSGTHASLWDCFALEHRIQDPTHVAPSSFLSLNRIGNNLDLYSNSSGSWATYASDHTGSSSSTGALTLAQQTAHVFVFATNFYSLPDGSDGVVIRLSTCNMSFFAFHQGLTLLQSASLWSFAKTMRQSLGGGSFP